MGRPLPKRFFGNENASGAAVGNGITSISWSDFGSFRTAPTITIPDPTNTGSTATAEFIYDVESVTTGAGNVGLVVGDQYTYGSSGNFVANVTDVSQTNAVFSVTATMANRGTGVLAIPNGGTTTTITLTRFKGAGAATFVADINWRIAAGQSDSLATTSSITSPGSGYVGTETITITGTGKPTGALVFSTPTGVPGDPNAFATIICTAQTTSGGSALTGDIVSQRSTRRYRVTTSDGTGVCKLVAASPTFGEMTIIATDYSGNTYYITKLTRHLATLTRNTGSTHEFATGASAGWKTDALVAGDTGIYVKIASS